MTEKLKAEQIQGGVVITGERGYRRIIGVLQGRAVYCRGADLKRDCKIETLVRWARETGATITHEPDSKTLPNQAA